MESDHVLLCYVVCDESFSMAEQLGALNDGLHELSRSVAADPAAARQIRLCVIGFAETPRIVLPLGPLERFSPFTGLRGGVASNFGPAFAFLRRTIEQDVAWLIRTHPLRRPMVFFLSDGQPTDPATWAESHARLTDARWAACPDLIAIGVGDADPDTIGRIGTCQAYVEPVRPGPGVATSTFVHSLISSIVLAGEPSPRRLADRG